MSSRALLGTVWAGLAGVAWGTNGALGGLLMVQGLSPILVSALRAFLASVLMLAWLLARRRPLPRMGRAALAWSALAGLSLCANFGLYFIGIQQAGVSVAVVLKATAPLFVIAIAALARIERLTPSKVSAALVVLAGVYLVAGGGGAAGAVVPLAGALSAIGAAVAYAGFTLAFRAAQRRAETGATVSVAFVVCTTGLFAWAGELPAWPAHWTLVQAGAIAHMAVVGTIFAFVAYNLGLARIEAGIAAVLATIEPLVAALLGWLLLDERLDPTQLLGAVLVLATVAVSSYRESRVPA